MTFGESAKPSAFAAGTIGRGLIGQPGAVSCLKCRIRPRPLQLAGEAKSDSCPEPARTETSSFLSSGLIAFSRSKRAKLLVSMCFWLLISDTLVPITDGSEGHEQDYRQLQGAARQKTAREFLRSNQSAPQLVGLLLEYHASILDKFGNRLRWHVGRRILDCRSSAFGDRPKKGLRIRLIFGHEP